MQTNVTTSKDTLAMNCPVCKSPALHATDLEAGLTFFNCHQCRGNWVRGVEYWKWLEQHGPNLPERSDQDSGLLLAEPGLHIDCPECRFRMVKYLVGHGFSFTIDHCGGCKGVWLDRNEWEALKERNLHDDLQFDVHFLLAGRSGKRGAEEAAGANLLSHDSALMIMPRSNEYAPGSPPAQISQELLAYLTDKDPFDV